MESKQRDMNTFIIIKMFLDEFEDSKLDFNLIINVCKSIDPEFFLDGIERYPYYRDDDKVSMVLTFDRQKLNKNITNIFDRIITELKGVHMKPEDESSPYFRYEFEEDDLLLSKPLDKKVRNKFLTDTIQEYEKKCKEIKNKFNDMIFS